MVLIPIVAAFYFYDFPAWLTELRLPLVQAAFLLVFSTLFLGIYFRRRLVGICLEASEIGFGRGLVFVAASAALFVYGSYSAYPMWFHYESLLALVIGYLALRVGIRVIRTLAPLLLILVFALIPFSAMTAVTSSAIMLAVFVCVLSSFVLFTGGDPNQIAVEGMMVLIALAALAGAVFGHVPYVSVLIPSPLLLLALPSVRKSADLNAVQDISQCTDHKILPNGFCTFCGKKVARATTSENFGGWGLLAVGVIVVLLIVSSMPALVLASGPNHAIYTTRGVSLTPLPLTPNGWQVNKTIIDSWDATTGTFENVRAYVPLVHPEVKNYTVYYSVSQGLSVPNPPSGIIPTWRFISSSLTPLGVFQGRMTTYTLGNSTMLSYGGKSAMTFVSGGKFVTADVTIGFVRVFKNLNIAADSQEFLSDIQAIWMPALATDSFNSGWTDFESNTIQGVSNLLPYTEVIVSVFLIGWVAYRVTSSEARLDRFYSRASLSKDRAWFILVQLVRSPRKGRTGFELRGFYNRLSERDVDSTLRSLAREGLVEPVVEADGNEMRLVWKAKA